MSIVISFVLPWPVKELSQNARVHWAEKADAVKDARAIGFWMVKRDQAQIPEIPKPKKIKVWYIFYPPDKKWRDADNMIGMCKSYQDGIFDGLGWNDHTAREGGWEVREIVPLGRVAYTIEVIE